MTKQLRVLLLIYWLGVPIALLIALSGSPHRLLISQSVPDVSTYLLAFSVSHMFVLFLFGLLVPQPDNRRAGAKIQMAGYLHTLIGVTSAIFAITSGISTVSLFVIPIGSALLTSIIGWFLGGEIEDRYSTMTPASSFQLELEKVLAELGGFPPALRQAQEQFVTTIREMGQEYKQLHRTQSEVFKTAIKMASKLNDTVGPLLAAVSKLADSVTKAADDVDDLFGDRLTSSLAKIGTQGERAASEFEKAANAAQDVAQYLKQHRVLIEELKKIMNLINLESNGHET